MLGVRLAVFVALALLPGLLPPGLARAAAPPNIVVVVTDDMRTSDWQALPKTKKLLADGTTFLNFFLTTPTCCPSRTSILTGQYAHNHGVLTNEDKGAPTGGLTAFRRQDLADDTVASALGRAGYRPGIVGKFLNGYAAGDRPIEGWDRWVVPADKGYTDFELNVDGETRRERGYSTDVLRDEAVRFIEETPDRQPLFLYFAPKAPHGPATPAARHRDRFRDATIGRDAAFDEAALDDKPAYVRRKSPLDDRDERRLDQLERDRLATLLAVDEAVAAIGETLDAEGRLEDTYVFVLSDNGFLLGDHRMEGKGSPYDGSVRVPMLAWGPKFDRGTDERLVGNIDIAPTIADVAGVRLPAADGQSLLDRSAREAILLERFKDGAKPTYEAIRTARWLYVEYATGETELYDYREDPDETNNLLAEANEDEGGRTAEVGALSRLLAELAGCKREGCRAAGQG
ncbi:MAG TPA: sulfatase [Thermomicrobiales bacterium]|nr:sulfatase [Thermomicrobiales bacterium]